MSIRALPSNTVRALGAGQVITDAVSVIKELLDNALDAGATSISLEVSANALDVIQIRDNGHGIFPQDRNLICHRHHTSKIRSEEDLNHIGGSVLGFRGEALASIAESCGGLSIATRTDAEHVATVMTFDRTGKITATTRASLPVGTLVKVTEFLQHNPVRHRLAIKRVPWTMLQIKQTLLAYAFARPQVRLSFKVLKQSGNDFIYAALDSSTIADAALKLFGVHCSSQCILAEGEHTGIQMQAFVPRPNVDMDRFTHAGCFISCDGRPMSTAKGVFKQICKLFRDVVQLSSPNKPRIIFFVLSIRCPGGWYDVNVEPNKDDVIFQDPEAVLSAARKLFEIVYGVQRDPPRLAVVGLGKDHRSLLLTPLPSSDLPQDCPGAHISTQITSESTPERVSAEHMPATVTSQPIASVRFPNEQAVGAVHNNSQIASARPPQSQRFPQYTSTRPARSRPHQSSKQAPRPISGTLAHDRVWFDHLEPIEKRERGYFTPINRRAKNDRAEGNDDDSTTILSPPRGNTDIRSFCQPVATSVLESSLPPTHVDKNRSSDPRLSPFEIAQARPLPSSAPLQERESNGDFSHDATQEVVQLTGRSAVRVASTGLPTPQSSLSMQSGLKTAHTASTADDGVFVAQHRDVQTQLLKLAELSTAVGYQSDMTIYLPDLDQHARLINMSSSVPPWHTGCLLPAMQWAEDLDASDINKVAHRLHEMLIPISTISIGVSHLQHSITAAIKKDHAGDASSEVDLLL